MTKGSYPSYTVPRRLPGWAQRGHTQFHNKHGGPAEVAKDVLYQASTIGFSFDDFMAADQTFFARLTPDVVWEWGMRYTDEFLDEMQALGKDLIQVTYSCGFSTKSEAVQRRIVTEFTAKAHRRGMRICAYFSLTNIYWKDAFEHEPELEPYVARYSDGRYHLYAYSLARYLACVNQPGWREYLKRKVCMAIEDTDVDAIYFDNLSATCACETCSKLFADFTRGLVGVACDLPPIEQVLPPGVRREGEDEIRVADTTQRAATDGEREYSRAYLHRMFAAHSIADALQEIRDYAFTLKTPLAFSANNHLFPFVNDVCNVLYSQDTVLPGPEWSNIPYLRHLAADSAGWKPVVTNHQPKDADPRLSMAEAMAFQSYPYQITHKPYNLFYKQHPELFTDVESVANIGVVLEWPRRKPRYLQPLGLNNLLYDVLVPGRVTPEVLNRYRVILLPDLEAASDRLCADLADFEQRGGVVIATGTSMAYDEFGRPRPDMPNPGPDGGPEQEIGEDVVRRIRQAAGPQPVEVDGDSGVVANLVRKTDGSAHVLHVVNYGPSPSRGIHIKLNIPNAQYTEATSYSPDDPSVTNPGLSVGAPLTLETVDVYALIRLR